MADNENPPLWQRLEKYRNLIFTAYIIFVILLSSSFGTLTPLEMGLIRNNIASSVDNTKVYMAGRYYHGVGKEFIRYPTT